MAYNKGTPLERFYQKIVVRLDTGCWEWVGHSRKAGYGTFWTGLRSDAPYRWSYEYFIGPIPDGYEADHLCKNIRCANPQHIEPVTKEENLRRQFEGITHCQRGHLLDEATAYIRKDTGRRQCRECKRLRRAGSVVVAVRRPRERAA